MTNCQPGRTAMKMTVCLLLAAFGVGAWSTTMPCQSSVPQCPDPYGSGGNGSVCGGGTGTYEFGDLEEFFYYLCNGQNSACDPSIAGASCNVMIRYVGMGRTVTCSSGGSWFCAESIDSPQTTNKKCGEDQPCDPNDGTLPIPSDLLPPSPWNNPRIDVGVVDILPRPGTGGPPGP